GSSAANWTQADLTAYYSSAYPAFSIGRAVGSWVQNSVQAYAGNGALSLQSVVPPNDTSSQWHGRYPVDGYWLSSTMSCTAGQAYMADAWLNMTINPAEPWYGPLEIRFYNSSGQQLNAANSPRAAIFDQLPANTWTYGATMPYVAPAGAVTMRLRFGQEFSASSYGGGGDGTVRADNLAVWALPAGTTLPDPVAIYENVPNFIHWFRTATATVQPPYLACPANADNYQNAWGTVENAVAGNLYYDASAASVLAMPVTNLLGESRNLSLQVVRTDWLGNASSPITIPAQAVSGFGTYTFNAALPATLSYGSFYLDVSVLDGTTVVGSFSGRYAVLPPLTRPDTAPNIWGVTPVSGITNPTTVVSDTYSTAGGNSLTLSGNAGNTRTGTLTPTGDANTYTASLQCSTLFNVALVAKQNAVGGEAGLVLTNNTGSAITATAGSFYTAVNVASKLGWTPGSITTAQVSTLVLGLDYLCSGFANPVTAGLYVDDNGTLVDGLSSYAPGTSLTTQTSTTHAAFFLSGQSAANIQTFTDFLNANGGVLRVQFSYSGVINAGASLAVADLLLTSTPASDQELGTLIKTAGFGLAYVRMYGDSFTNIASATDLAAARSQIEWYRNLGLRCVLQVMGGSGYTTPVNYSTFYTAGQTIATQFKDIVAAIGDWAIELSQHCSQSNPDFRPVDQNGQVMSDATYDNIMVNIYNGVKSISPSLPVLIGNIATDPTAGTISRMYNSPVNGSFDGAIVNNYYSQTQTLTNDLALFDAHGDTTKKVWLEENAEQSSPSSGPTRATGEGVGASNLVLWRMTEASLFYGRIGSVTTWSFSAPGSDWALVNAALQPRPQYVAQAVMDDAFADATFVADSTVGAVNAFEWSRGDGPIMMLCANSWAGTQSFTLNVANGSYISMDVLGNRTTVSVVGHSLTINVGT
ncbi:MAG: hypothetical protein WCI73_12630, partial [Phycisphaerae bacterium]